MKTTNFSSYRLLQVTILLLSFIVTGPTSPAATTNIIVPNNLAGGDANLADNVPFAYSSPLRLQQVYDSSQFSGISQGGGWITALSFRGDARPQSFSSTVSNLQLNLSTTTKVPDG